MKNLPDMNRVWAMPNKNTFSIKPIGDLIVRHLTGVSIDPFANSNKLATVTNDLDPEFDTDYHLDALDFLKQFEDESVDVVLFDPPYSPRQVSECYKSLDMSVNMQTTQSSFWANMKREIARITKHGGKVVTCGWNSGGIGKTAGFTQLEILLVPHGGWHNDTIVTVELKN
ncbi:MAG: adenine-specific DNA methylase [Gammaproteobacteria bacterium]|nr:adenine-specific DNA methylase [Gammaproteobacteria bacterium]